MTMFLGVVGIVMLIVGCISRLVNDFRDVGVFQKPSKGLTREEMTAAIVKRDRHGKMLQWLNDPNNYPEIEKHVSGVLSEIWERPVHYIPKRDANTDIRKVIYFAENGFLPSASASDIYRVLWTDADRDPLGLSRMSGEEKEKLYAWVLDTMAKNGYNITTMLPSGGMWTFAK